MFFSKRVIILVKRNLDFILKLKQIGRLLSAILFVISFPSCSSITPHDNFKSLMGHNVGSRIDNPNVIGSTNPKYLIESKKKPNGNMENKYRGKGTCRIYFEYNPETLIITGWLYEGSKKDCSIVP